MFRHLDYEINVNKGDPRNPRTSIPRETTMIPQYSNWGKVKYWLSKDDRSDVQIVEVTVYTLSQVNFFQRYYILHLWLGSTEVYSPSITPAAEKFALDNNFEIRDVYGDDEDSLFCAVADQFMINGCPGHTEISLREATVM